MIPEGTKGAYVIAEFEVVVRKGHVRDDFHTARFIARRFGEETGLDGGEPMLDESVWLSDIGRVFAWKAAGTLSLEQLKRLEGELLDREIGEGEPTMGSLAEHGHIPAEGHSFAEGWGYGYYQPDVISSAYVSLYGDYDTEEDKS